MLPPKGDDGKRSRDIVCPRIPLYYILGRLPTEVPRQPILSVVTSSRDPLIIHVVNSKSKHLPNNLLAPFVTKQTKLSRKPKKSLIKPNKKTLTTG